MESYTESTCVSIKARKNILKMSLREERVLKMIQATMFKVTEDVSCCTDKCMQALEALFGEMWCKLLSIKFNIVLNFQLLT